MDAKEMVTGLVSQAAIGVPLEYSVEVFFPEPQSDARFRREIMSLPAIGLNR